MKFSISVKQLNKYNDVEDINKYINLVSFSKFKNLNIEIGPFKYLLNNNNYLEEVLKIKSFCETKKLNIVSTHAPYINNLYWNKITENEEAEFISLIKKSLMVTKTLEAKLMVLHLGTFMDNNIYNYKKSVSKNIDFLLNFTEFAKNLKIKIAIENHTNFENGYYPSLNELFEIANSVNSKVKQDIISICFDTGHANLAKEDDLNEILKINKLLQVLHVHDNDGISDEHKEIAQGMVDWVKINSSLMQINYSGLIISEVRYNKDILLNISDNKNCFNETYLIMKKIFSK